MRTKIVRVLACCLIAAALAPVATTLAAAAAGAAPGTCARYPLWADQQNQGLTRNGSAAGVRKAVVDFQILRAKDSCPLGVLEIRGATATRTAVSSSDLVVLPVPPQGGTAHATRLVVQNECGQPVFAPLIVNSSPARLAFRQACQATSLTVVALPSATGTAVREPTDTCVWVGLDILRAQNSTARAVRLDINLQTLNVSQPDSGDGYVFVRAVFTLYDGAATAVQSEADAPAAPGDHAPTPQMQGSCVAP